MFKRTLIVCASVFATLVCTSGNVALDNVRRANGYYEDGFISQAEKDADKLANEKRREELDPYVTSVDGQLVLDAEGAKANGYSDDAVLECMQENFDFVNNLSSESNGLVEIDENRELIFNIEDEYMEQWQAWELSWKWWALEWTYKLDSDFGLVIGVLGVVFNLVNYLVNGPGILDILLTFGANQEYYENMIKEVLAAIMSHPEGKKIADNIISFLHENWLLVATTISACSAVIFAMKMEASEGAMELISLILDWLTKKWLPGLILSATLLFNYFANRSPLYCRISLIFFKADYSMTAF